MRRFLVVMLVLVLAAPLAGCGRKSPPVAPADSTYPRTYPTQ